MPFRELKFSPEEQRKILTLIQNKIDHDWNTENPDKRFTKTYFANKCHDVITALEKLPQVYLYVFCSTRKICFFLRTGYTVNMYFK